MILKIDTKKLSLDTLCKVLMQMGYEYKEEDRFSYMKDWNNSINDTFWKGGNAYSKSRYAERVLEELEDDI